MKEIFNNNNIGIMYRIINVLLLGTDQTINTACLLFGLLKDKKLGSDNIANVIYRNLSFINQIKLKKAAKYIATELERLKTLTSEDVDIKKKLATMINMPDNVKAYVIEKLSESKSSGDNNYKAQMAINALMNYPWKSKNAKSEYEEIRKCHNKSREYMKNVAYQLDNSVYGHSKTKKLLLEMVAKWLQNPESSGQAVGLVGPPGCGKTLLAQSISKALNIPFVMIPLGGANDANDLIGHNYTYSGAQYGMIVRQMIKANNWRCVMLFDEVDKACSKNGSNEIFNVLIHITDQTNNNKFQDKFFSSSIEFDLSGVLMIFSYNDSDKIDPILMDRIFEIDVKPYSINDKVSIVKNYMFKELCQTIGFRPESITLSETNIRYIIEKYTTEAGVRELKRKLETILLKLNIDRIYIKGPFKKLLSRKINIYKHLQKKNNSSDKLNSIDKINKIDKIDKSNLKKYETSFSILHDNDSSFNDSLMDNDDNVMKLNNLLRDDSQTWKKKSSQDIINLNDTSNINDDIAYDDDILADDTLVALVDNKNDSDSYEYSDNECQNLQKYIDHNNNSLKDEINDAIMNDVFNMNIEYGVYISKKLIHRYLNLPPLHITEVHKKNLIGVINGLYATTIGLGGILPIQILPNYFGDNTNEDDIKLKLTGSQGKVMKESVHCALSAALRILSEDHKKNILKKFPNGFHIHAPDGATPKDGPSAGCAFATAFVSIIIGKKINREIAMTGEIELTGRVTKIGGLIYKLTGAKKAGIKKIFICDENKDDFNKIKKTNHELFESNFEIVIVNHLIEIVSDKSVLIDVEPSDFDPDLYNEFINTKDNSNIQSLQ
jgi:ATP-dependent Lon protease